MLSFVDPTLGGGRGMMSCGLIALVVMAMVIVDIVGMLAINV